MAAPERRLAAILTIPPARVATLLRVVVEMSKSEVVRVAMKLVTAARAPIKEVMTPPT